MYNIFVLITQYFYNKMIFFILYAAYILIIIFYHINIYNILYDYEFYIIYEDYL